MKKKKIICVSIFFLLICGIGVGGSIVWIKQKESVTEEEIKVKKNQNLIIAQVNTINGNEITFSEAEEMELSSAKGGTNGANIAVSGDHASESENFSDKGQNRGDEISTDNAINGQQMPQDGMEDANEQSSGGVTRRGMSSGDMPDGGMSDSNRLGDSRTAEKGGAEYDRAKSKTMYRVMGEEKTMLIPVGTVVTTYLGTTTTFSRLAAGDMVKILMEKNENHEDVIVGIWMIQ